MKPQNPPLFQKVHLRLTLLCAGITTLVLVLMSVSYLFITEKNLRDNHFSSFRRDMNTLLANFETQTLFTHEWLSKIEDNGKYLIQISDNGKPFLWGTLQNDPARELPFAAAWDYFNARFQVASPSTPFYTTHVEFSFSSVERAEQDFYGCAAFSHRTTGTLTLMILEPLAPLNDRIHSQRLTFVFLVLGSSLVLSLFSWYFTGKLLAPIEENRQSQIRFVAAASHELRTPLSVILSASSACKKAAPEEQEKFLGIIQEEGSSMSRLITDLLSLAGADSQSFPLVPAPCEADTLLLNVYEAFEPLAWEKKYQLSIELPDKKTAPVVCDSDRIRQVLSILLHNAFSYTPVGSAIRLSLREEPGWTQFIVADNGPGIREDAKPHIFDRFYREDTARQASGHFGLGLAIASEIMRAHHGSIHVSDTPGGGATFTLRLPHAKS